MTTASVGIIGGSGLYAVEGLADIERFFPDTPYGKPSDEIVVGSFNGVRTAFVPRHGRGHTISPSELPARANIWALKMLGVSRIVSVSAVGSLRQHLEPRHVVIPDQLFDRTKGGRPATFFGEGIVAHIGFAEPYCPTLSKIVTEAARDIMHAGVHAGGTMVAMEGPQFSTKAESFFYRQIGADLIGMTALPEAKLAREAEICYCTLAMVTDYDCWHPSAEAVSVDMVIGNLLANADHARQIIESVLPRIIKGERDCACGHALENAIITQPEAMPSDRVEQLRPLIGKYLP